MATTNTEIDDSHHLQHQQTRPHRNPTSKKGGKKQLFFLLNQILLFGQVFFTLG
jgi:hypothetical protein